jgi:hypothetical protein
MNHREPVLSARKKARFAFLGLPEDLQDEIVEGLDGRTLTLLEASALVKSRGHSLSHEAIAGYYRAVRTERRLLEANQELSRVIAEYASKPQKEALEGLTNLVIAMAASGLADGSVGIKDINLPKLIESMGRSGGVSPRTDGCPAESPAAGGGDGAAQRKGQVSAETLESIRRDVYGF